MKKQESERASFCVTVNRCARVAALPGMHAAPPFRITDAGRAGESSHRCRRVEMVGGSLSHPLNASDIVCRPPLLDSINNISLHEVYVRWICNEAGVSGPPPPVETVGGWIHLQKATVNYWCHGPKSFQLVGKSNSHIRIYWRTPPVCTSRIYRPARAATGRRGDVLGIHTVFLEMPQRNSACPVYIVISS